MNINDEGAEIFSFRVDQNKDSFFKCHLLQRFDKGTPHEIQVVHIKQDYNELNIHGKSVYKIVARNTEEMDFVWQKFEDCKGVQVIYKKPNMTDVEQLNELLQDESYWS